MSNYCLDNHIHLACLSETWFQDDTNYQTALFSEAGSYTSHNHPRKTETTGGGVCIFMKNMYKTVKQKKTVNSAFESVSILCCISGLPSQKLKVVSMYRREAVVFSTFIEQFSKFVQNLILSKYPFVIGGDFNIHMNNANHSYTKRFLKLCENHNLNLSHVPKVKTHKAGNTIDFLVCDNTASSLVIECTVDYDAPNISHHFPVVYSLKAALQCRSVAVTKPKRSFLNFDVDKFKLELSKSLEDLQLCDSFQSKYNTFQEKLKISYDKHVPLRVSKICHNARPKWMDHEYVKQHALRRKFERLYKRTNSRQDEINWKLQRTKCSLLAAEKRDSMYTNGFKNAKGNIKAQFNMLEKLIGETADPFVQKLPDVSEYGSNYNLASDFNKFFMDKVKAVQSYIETEKQTYQLDKCDTSAYLPPNDQNHSVKYLSEFKLCDLEELREIVYRSIKTTHGIDPLPSNTMAQCMDVLLPHLLDLVNTSLLTGSVDGVKFSFVKPLLKKVDLALSLFPSYRPISNLSFISKLVERVVVKRLNEHMTSNNLHVDSQHGYKSGHSTETLLIKFINDILVAIDQNRGVVVLLIDLSAAFDTVQHSILLKILKKAMFITGTALEWFQSFLCGRSQAVVIDGVLSDWLTVTCGVQQGSVLGPILFNIYCRHIHNVFLKCGFSSSSYADDNSAMKSFAVFNQLHTLYEDIPNCLERLKIYMIENHLKLNDAKTEVIVFGSSRFKEQVSLHGTFLRSGKCIRFNDNVKYLGVFLDSMLAFDDQVQKVTSLSYASMRNIAKVKNCLSQQNLETFVHAFISSHLDYCNIIYLGLPKKLMNKLQKLQNAAIRLIFKVRARHPVSSLFQKLHWLNIEQRVVFKVLLVVFKCINGLAPNALKSLITVRNTETLLLRQTYFNNTKFGKRAFVYYAPKYWNSLPCDMRLLSDIGKFKTSLKSYLLLHYIEFRERISI